MKRCGILAYGSLIDNPGKEIEAATVDRIEDVRTPFKVEFARSSITRGGAPTLVPVGDDGASVKAQIFVLKEGISEKDAMDMLWRRETHKVGSGKSYKRPVQPNEKAVLIEYLKDLHGLDLVLYVKIGANIKPLTPQHLAELAVESAQSEAGAKGLDGIRYLINAKRNGVATPLMPKYEEEILKKAGAADLDEASLILHLKRLKKEGKIPEATELLKTLPTPQDTGKLVMFRAKIGKTYIKLSPPIVLVREQEGKKYSTPYSTKFLDLEARVDKSYLYVGFKKGFKRNAAIDYFNNLMALFNIIFIPFDFVYPSDILVEAAGLGTKIEMISSSKAHSRGYGVQPVEIILIDFTKVVLAIQYLWEKLKKSEYFKRDNFYQLLGYAQYYLFHENNFLSFIHAWIFLESCINILWRGLIHESFNINSSSQKGTPLEEERNWTIQIKIDELFLKEIINESLRRDLQSLRNKRNKVFHRDKQLKRREVTAEDARKATTTGLRLFYTMIELEPKDEVFAFLDIKREMWEAVNRGRLYRT